MSHIVTIKTRLYDAVAIAKACERIQISAPARGTAKLFSAEATGLMVKLPGWQYPAVIDTNVGTVCFDNFEGKWGDPAQMDRFLQAYAVEKCRLEAEKQGHSVGEQLLLDGSIKLQIYQS